MLNKEIKITVDFDNTCALEDFPLVGADVPYAVETLKRLASNGVKLILWTCRQNEQLKDAVEWFRRNDILLFGVNEDPQPDETLAALYGIPRKIIGDFNIDDRNLGCPTIDIESNGKVYTVVDWRTLEEILKEKGLI